MALPSNASEYSLAKGHLSKPTQRHGCRRSLVLLLKAFSADFYEWMAHSNVSTHHHSYSPPIQVVSYLILLPGMFQRGRDCCMVDWKRVISVERRSDIGILLR